MSANDQRLEHLESLLMHLQHDFDQLGQVVWRQQSEIDSLRQEVTRLTDQFAELSEAPEQRDPLAEKPPHY